ncbi:hypothetical protein [Frigidibacter sp. SD6-1]|uniref:hypothetical protein n=1 Tax=Frigidibacter sp. SD6-1 TaxID=3032581 RepID=UPI0024DFC363|nr:hypothetical protein [Frigidibacter sp. SD6-1]
MTYPRIIDDGSVWIVIMPPVIWAGHFLAAYWIAAVWCARGMGVLAPAAWAILALTLIALAAIGWIARIATVRYEGLLRHEASIADDRERSRERFLGHVALLLCALNAVAVIFTAAPSLVFGQC